MHTSIRLASNLDSAAVARRSVEWFTRDLDLDLAAASLIATELVTNAVRHGGEPIVLHLRFEDGALSLEVSDGDRTEPQVCEAGDRNDGERGGIGLLLVDRLSRRWGVRQSPRGWKTVWAEVDCALPASTTESTAATDGLVALRAERERQVADFERFLAVSERKLGAQVAAEIASGSASAMTPSTAELHDAAAALHEQAAALHERIAGMVDARTHELHRRYGPS